MPPPASPDAAKNKKKSTANTNSNSVVGMSTPSSAQASDSNYSGVFSKTTKLATKGICGDGCWACGSRPVEIAHVFGQEDPQVSLWKESALITFPLTKVDNAIPLCGLCHANFDEASDPGFVFIPSDLEYFINFELEDRRRRLEEARNGVIPDRKVPTAATYKEHQIKNGQVKEEDIGGLYNRHFTKDYLLGNQVSIEIRRRLFSDLTKPKPWHGSPIAALRKAIPIIGSVRIKFIGSDTEMKLKKIRDLYFVDELDPPKSGSIANASENAGDMGQSHKRNAEDDDETPPKKKSKQDTKGSKRSSGRIAAQGTSNMKNVKAEPLSTECSDWVLGPTASAEDAVQLFAHIFTDG